MYRYKKSMHPMHASIKSNASIHDMMVKEVTYRNQMV